MHVWLNAFVVLLWERIAQISWKIWIGHLKTTILTTPSFLLRSSTFTNIYYINQCLANKKRKLTKWGKKPNSYIIFIIKLINGLTEWCRFWTVTVVTTPKDWYANKNFIIDMYSLGTWMQRPGGADWLVVGWLSATYVHNEPAYESRSVFCDCIFSGVYKTDCRRWIAAKPWCVPLLCNTALGLIRNHWNESGK